MRVYLILVLLCINYQVVLAQQSLSDSLQKRLSQPIPDTTRVQVLEQLGRALMYSKPIEAMQRVQEGLRIAQRINYPRGEARILNRMGTIFQTTTNYDRSLKAHLASIQIAEASQDLDLLVRNYNNVGNLYTEQENWPKGVENLDKARMLAEQANDDELRQLTLVNLGYNYVNQHKLDSALKYTRMAYALALKLHMKDQFIDLSNVAGVYKEMGRYRQAMEYYREILPGSIRDKDNRVISQTYFEMAEIFEKTNRLDSAIIYADKSVQIARESNFLPKLLNGYRLLSAL